MNARDSNICPFILNMHKQLLKILTKKRVRFFLWRFEAVAAPPDRGADSRS